MKKVTLSLIMFSFSVLFFIQTTFAGCYVEDGTYYSNSKYDMITFAIAMDQGNRQKALQMVDEGRIGSCSQASAIVLKREKGVVNVNISGIGEVWIYETFLHCN